MGGHPSPHPSYPTMLGGERRRHYKKDRTSGVFHPSMNPDQDLKVEEILKDVKSDWVQDDSVDQFAQQLKQRERQKRVAQVE